MISPDTTLDEWIKKSSCCGGMPKIGVSFWETKDLDITDIAKRVRKDIVAYKKSGALHGDTKSSVRISKYSMGQSITVKATEVPKENDWELRTVRSLKSIIDSYNYDFSDPMVDYYRVRFHKIIDVNGRQR
jgi:hypothetical protein